MMKRKSEKKKKKGGGGHTQLRIPDISQNPILVNQDPILVNHGSRSALSFCLLPLLSGEKEMFAWFFIVLREVAQLGVWMVNSCVNKVFISPFSTAGAPGPPRRSGSATCCAAWALMTSTRNAVSLPLSHWSTPAFPAIYCTDCALVLSIQRKGLMAVNTGAILTIWSQNYRDLLSWSHILPEKKLQFFVVSSQLYLCMIPVSEISLHFFLHLVLFAFFCDLVICTPCIPKKF